MEFVIREKERKIIIKENNHIISLSENEFRNIEREFNKTIYYKDDVKSRISTLVESNDLPEEAVNNDKYIDAVTNKYSEIRNEYGDGTDENMSWTECLNEAFNSTSYDDFT